MNAVTEPLANIGWHRVQQVIKWVVYFLLLISLVLYIIEDANRALHTLTPNSGLFNYTSEFATSIDVAAWIILLIMLELETYILKGKNWQGWVATLVRGTRLVCVAMIAHTVIANADAVNDQLPTLQWGNTSNLCDLADTGISFVYNLEYTDITVENCGQLPAAERYFKVGLDPVVSTLKGLELERNLTYVDLIEVVAWVLIVLATEVALRIRNRSITSDGFLNFVNRSKLVLYLTAVGIAVYWASLGHWLYMWEEFIWIAGFGAIESNINE